MIYSFELNIVSRLSHAELPSQCEAGVVGSVSGVTIIQEIPTGRTSVGETLLVIAISLVFRLIEYRRGSVAQICVRIFDCVLLTVPL